MRFLHPDRDRALELRLSLDDVFLVPSCFDGLSRLDVDRAPAGLPGGARPSCPPT